MKFVKTYEVLPEREVPLRLSGREEKRLRVSPCFLCDALVYTGMFQCWRCDSVIYYPEWLPSKDDMEPSWTEVLCAGKLSWYTSDELKRIKDAVAEASHARRDRSWLQLGPITQKEKRIKSYETRTPAGMANRVDNDFYRGHRSAFIRKATTVATVGLRLKDDQRFREKLCNFFMFSERYLAGPGYHLSICCRRAIQIARNKGEIMAAGIMVEPYAP